MSWVGNLLRRGRGRLLGRPDLAWYRAQGAVIGREVHLGPESLLDPQHCWLITVGDRVTFAPRVHVLAHDASTKRAVGRTLIAPVVIEDDVFLGAGTIVLPGVTIGRGAVIGAGSVVSRDVPPDAVAVGCPAVPVRTTAEVADGHRAALADADLFDATWTREGGISADRRAEMRRRLTGRRGYVV